MNDLKVIDTDTGEAIEPCDEYRARDLTDKIKTSLGVAWELVKDAYRERAWAALGYRSWDHYCTEEFGAHRLRLPREERAEVVSSLRDSGLSVRAIAAATGTGVGSVHRALNESPVPDGTPDPEPTEPTVETVRETKTTTTVTGTDGKTYPSAPKQAPAKPQRRPLTDSFFDACHDLTKAVDRIDRLTEDDRFPRNAEQVALKHRSDLLRANDALAKALARLPEG